MGEETAREKISTLIFMDLETTGLPSDVGKKNVQIIEMSFVAIDRDCFEEDQNFRTVNKLSLCVRPRSVVSPGAMRITGLYNDILENQEEFDDSVPKLLEYFFRRLQTPICLLAHNGKRFDFPVLQAELKRINYSLGENILCADTLTAFRSICLYPKPVQSLEPSKEKNTLKKDIKCYNGVSITEDDIESLLLEDLESFSEMSCISASNGKKLEQGVDKINPETSKISAHDFNTKKKRAPINEFLNPLENEKTPTNRKILPNINTRAMNLNKRKILDPPYSPKNEDIRGVKRTLFPEPSSTTPPKLTKFSLESIYTEFFKESPPQSHFAEIDCISLSKVCQKINKDFLHWIDENSEAFCDINALW